MHGETLKISLTVLTFRSTVMIKCVTKFNLRKQCIFCYVSYIFQNKNLRILVFVLELPYF